MKAIVTLVLLLSLPRPPVSLPPRSPVEHTPARTRKAGRWYFAENGHAVYCYGPVVVLPQVAGGLQRVATLCRGERAMVPLKD